MQDDTTPPRPSDASGGSDAASPASKQAPRGIFDDMPQPTPPPPAPTAPPPAAPLLWAMRLFCLLGIGVSVHLLIPYLQGQTSVAGCGGSEVLNCDHALRSKWASIVGVPVTAPAILVYLGILAASIPLGRPLAGGGRHPAWMATLLLAFLAGAAAVWFIGLQVFTIGAICLWCMVAHACSLAIVALAVVAHPTPQASAEDTVRLTRLGVQAPLAAVALALVAGLAAGQAAGPEPAGQVRRDFGGGNFDTGPGPDRQFSVLGKVALRPADYPLLGPADADRLAVYLFDYTCAHCRRMHDFLEQAVTRYDGQLAVVLMPMPLDRSCNPHVRQMQPAAGPACELARLAMGVHRYAPDQFHAFDRWLVEQARNNPQVAQAARDRAGEILGQQRVNLLQHDEQVTSDIQRHALLWNMTEEGVIPVFILASSTIIGSPNRLDELYALLESEGYGLTPPAGSPAHTPTPQPNDNASPGPIGPGEAP